MGFLGKILSTPVRLVNAPLRALERVVDGDSELGDKENILSTPLEALARALDEIDED